MESQNLQARSRNESGAILTICHGHPGMAVNALFETRILGILGLGCTPFTRLLNADTTVRAN